MNVYNLICFIVSEKKKISENEVTIQGFQSLLRFKLLPKDKELIISLTEMETRMSQILQPSLWSAPLISRVQFLEKCVCVFKDREDICCFISKIQVEFK